ncbi:hypothetical protein B7463_g2363, partial [Scytalidium lignicola]
MTSSQENFTLNLGSRVPARLLHESDTLLSEEEARLWEDSERLFSENDTFVEILKVDRTNTESLSISDHKDLDQFLKNEKACYSKVDAKVLHDYKLSFADAQRLQYLHKYILRSEEAVAQALETIKGLQQLRLKLYSAKIVATPECDVLVMSANQFQNHRSVFAALKEFRYGVTQLVFEALANRNNQAMFDLGRSLNALTTQTNKETAAMNEISEEMRKDSRSMWVLTSAALIYLPASLVAQQAMYNPLHPMITEFFALGYI